MLTSRITEIQSKMIQILADQFPSEVLNLLATTYPAEMLNMLVEDDEFILAMIEMSYPGVLEHLSQEQLDRTKGPFRETFLGLIRQRRQQLSNTTDN